MSTTGLEYLNGFKAQAYYSVSAVNGTGTGFRYDDFAFDGTTPHFVPFDNLFDVTLNADAPQIDITTRAEARTGWSAFTFGPKGGTVSCDIRWHSAPSAFPAIAAPAYTAFKLIEQAWLTNGSVAMLFLDQPATVPNAQGLIANFSVTFNKQEAIGDVQKCTATLAINSHPNWVYSNGAATPGNIALDLDEFTTATA